MKQEIIPVEEPKKNSLTAEQIDLLKKTICVGATDQELQLFMHQCDRMQLDPFVKQIYFIKLGGKMTIVVSIDGYRLVAERTRRYMPGREPLYKFDDKGHLVSATCYVKKFGPDKQWHEVGATAMYREYAKQGGVWEKMPCVMLAKCAEALALRRAFPSDFSGVYVQEELDRASAEQDHGNYPAQVERKNPDEEMISEEDAMYIEDCIPKGDTQYRNDLLSVFAQKYKIDNIQFFTQIPKKHIDAIYRSIRRRYESLQKEVGEK